MEGGRTQQSAIGGASSASSSISVRSFGRSCTQTLSSLSTASPVTPPIFHLFGRGFGQSASTLYFGALCVCAANPTPSANSASAPKTTSALIRHPRSNLVFMTSLLHQSKLVSNPSAASLIPLKTPVNKQRNSTIGAQSSLSGQVSLYNLPCPSWASTWYIPLLGL